MTPMARGRLVSMGDRAVRGTGPRNRDVFWILIFLAGLSSAGQGLCGQAEPPPDRPLKRPADLRLDLEGPVRTYLDAITRNWLLPAPRANPAILAMFADRDRAPYRDLLPWSGEFAGKYLTGATQVYAGHRRPRACSHAPASSSPSSSPLQDTDGYLGPFPKEHRLTGSRPEHRRGRPGPPGTPGGIIT